MKVLKITIISSIFLIAACGEVFRESSKPENPSTPQAQMADQIANLAADVIDSTLEQVIIDIKSAPLWSEIGWARQQFCQTGQSQYISYLLPSLSTNQLYTEICF